MNAPGFLKDSPLWAPLQYRSLIWQFTRREVLARYRGSLLGMGWYLLTPLLMLSVYAFVFSTVFKARWPGVATGNVEFALQLFAGLIVFNLFAEVAARAPRLILDQPNLVRKVVFPLEILPWVAVLAALFHAALNLVVLLAACLILRGTVPPSWLALPLVLGAYLPLLLGLAWLLASIGVFLRDIDQVMNLLVSLAMFLSPIFYPPSALPPSLQPWLALNPLAVPIEAVRHTVLAGQWPAWGILAAYFALAGSFALVGAHWFRLTRKGFADVV